MISAHAHAYLYSLSDDRRAHVLGLAWDALDATDGVGCEASEVAAIEFAVVRDRHARARGREQVPF